MKSAIPIIIAVLLFVSCVQKTKKQTVIFYVDANTIDNVAKMSVRGGMAPLQWNQNLPLEFDPADSIYKAVVTFDIPYDFVELKFVKNEDEFELEGKPNRKLVFEEDQETLYRVVFDKEMAN